MPTKALFQYEEETKLNLWYMLCADRIDTIAVMINRYPVKNPKFKFKSTIIKIRIDPIIPEISEDMNILFFVI